MFALCFAQCLRRGRYCANLEGRRTVHNYTSYVLLTGSKAEGVKSTAKHRAQRVQGRG